MDIEDREERLDALLSRKNIDPDVFARVMDTLDSIASDREYLDENGKGFEYHLLDYLNQFDGVACTCNAPNCPLKKGRVPDAFELTDLDLEEAVRKWSERHSGTPTALVEAHESYGNRRQRVKRAYDECATALRSEDTEVITVYE